MFLISFENILLKNKNWADQQPGNGHCAYYEFVENQYGQQAS